MITDAIAEATPRPAVPYANKQIGTPILPVLGKTSVEVLLSDLFKKN